MMRNLKARCRDLLDGNPFFVPAQRAYQTIFNPDAAAERCLTKRFYAQFIEKGSLVFDIGANVGEYAEIFASLGATVVAVEPNPACCQVLKKLSRRSVVVVEQCAAGDSAGFVNLHVCQESHLSTVSEQWLDQTRAIPSLSGARWLNAIPVPVTTLDMLANRHGVPQFVKIDVEGYEDKVLSGMSFSPQFLSFEYHTEAREALVRCLHRLKNYSFNLIAGRELRFVLPRWSSAPDITEWISRYNGDQDFGEIFTKRLT
jgi:FkbM family methyltransferase